jgi:hypothetical protein
MDRVVGKYAASVARLFSSRVIQELATTGSSQLAGDILREAGIAEHLDSAMTVAECFDLLHHILLREYRSEYVYKNAIANKVLLGKHSLNTSFMLTEFRVLNSRADVVVLNGSSHVYEIKSEFDSVSRLKQQVDAYRQVFDFVSVITSESQQEAVMKEVDEGIGVVLLTDRYTIRTLREGVSHKEQVNPLAVIDSLRRHEYIELIRDYYGFVPNAPNTQIHKMCKGLLRRIPSSILHDLMVKVLKERGESQSLKELVTYAPQSLKAASLACNLSWQERSHFADALQVRIDRSLLAV